MPQSETLPAYTCDPKRLRIDIAGQTTAGNKGLIVGLDSDDDVTRSWRASVAMEFRSAIVFGSGDVQIVSENGKETRSPVPPPGPVQPESLAGEVYTPHGLRTAIDRENRGTFQELVAQVRSPMGVVPFVGAGMSMEFGFLGWGDFLRNAAEFHSNPSKVLAAMKKEDYLAAATLLFEDSPDRFQRMVAQTFGREIDESELASKSAEIIPLLARGPVITTNFDHVLEAAFRFAGRPFERVVPGPQPDKVVRAMHRNEPVLLKIHGDAEDRTSRVFTGLEYDEQYPQPSLQLQPGPDPASEKSVVNITSLAWIMFTNRPLLFLGCSLDRDRTLDVLHKIKDLLPALTHYAVIAAPYRVDKLRERRREMDQYGISPLWFRSGEFKRIRAILVELVQEASTRLLFPAGNAARVTPQVEPVKVAFPLATAPEPSPGDNATVSSPLLRRLARKAMSGRLAFFLGAAAHLGSLPVARDLYRDLAADFEVSDKDWQRADVAQYIVDREGREELWADTKELLWSDTVRPSAVYQLIAALPALVRLALRPENAWQWVLTTNYDTILERAFSEREEPFHLFYYQADGPDEGRFLHRLPDGAIRVIEQPINIKSLEGAHVLVKLDGGIRWDMRFRESVAIAPADFAASAGRILTALPQAVLSVLRDRSLLCLGSSLMDAHVQRVVRWSAGQDRTLKTWAVQNSNVFQEYWAAANVEIISSGLELLPSFQAELLRCGNPAEQAATP